MPELPEITVYAERLKDLAAGRELQGIRLASPFALRTVDPQPAAFASRVLQDVGRIGKRIVMAFAGDRFALIHLMLAGRLLWRPPGAPIPQGTGLFAFDFGSGTLVATESSKRHRASLHLVAGEGALGAFRRRGADVLSSGPEALAAALRRENRTLKRALTDPDIVDGIGNKFSDEILHRARLSPFARTGGLDDAAIRRLHEAAVDVLTGWTRRLRAEAGSGFPPHAAELRSGMAVHGRYGKPCPVCGAPVQRVVYAESESNYCPGCQTKGRVLADRSLSRLLKNDWPKTLEQLERLHPGDPRAAGR